MTNVKSVSIRITLGGKESNCLDALLPAIRPKTLPDDVVPRPGVDEDGYRHLQFVRARPPNLKPQNETGRAIHMGLSRPPWTYSLQNSSSRLMFS